MLRLPACIIRASKFSLIILVIAASAASAPAQLAAPDRTPLPMIDPLQDKNFYLLSLIERSAEARTAIAGNATLVHLKSDRQAALTEAVSGMDRQADIYAGPFLWSAQQIAKVAEVLRDLYQSNAAVRLLADKQLRASGTGPEALAGADVLAETWNLEAAGMNQIVAAYGEGKALHDSDIDGLAYDVNSEDYREFLHELARTISAQDKPDLPFFSATLHFSMALLEANQRDEAARFEPLETGENAAALARLKTIDWSRYAYSTILVPGIGPELPAVPISPMGRLHVAAAAALYKSGKAPFLLLSGGYVHPRQTPFNEAVEMKRMLIDVFHVPEQAILIDPHARHTTTNLRNAARLLYRDSFPLDKPVWIVSDIYQSDYIDSQEFADRCSRIFGYRPFRKLNRVSPNGLEWLPNYEASLVQDSRDPLDP